MRLLSPSRPTTPWRLQLVQQLTVNWGASFACLRSNLVAAQVGRRA